MATVPTILRACPCCGLAQTVPPIPPRSKALCARCGDTIAKPSGAGGRALSRVAALSTAALIMYPAAMLLPVLEVQRMGHRHSATIWTGAMEMLRGGETAIGLIVLFFSIIVPLAKLLGMLLLCTRARAFNHRHRLLTYRLIEFLGRWGMVDVLLVAVLIAAIKLGAWMDVSPGPGVVAFASVVLLSLLASAFFDPAAIWQEAHDGDPNQGARVGTV